MDGASVLATHVRRLIAKNRCLVEARVVMYPTCRRPADSEHEGGELYDRTVHENIIKERFPLGEGMSPVFLVGTLEPRDFE
jgi:hypothetical protein